MRARGFPPVAGRAPRVLILGSLPGAASIALGQYYGHPRNRFWELLGDALGEDLRALPYAKRLSRLKRRGVALWDVIADARRRGSLDADIRDPRRNPVRAFVEKTRVAAVFFNGAAAKKAFERLPGRTAARLILLPSSSPANAAVPLSRKRARWRRIRSFL